jgi:two-component system cell cycle response regulator DivK
MSNDKTKKIFVVEDNELNQKLFCDLLRSRKYEVAATADGNQAIEMIRRFIPDLVLMDVQLQNNISGTELIRQIKADKYIGSIPIIAVTAFAMKNDREQILKSGCDAYIAKPISIEPFFNTIAEFLAKKPVGEV